MSENKSEASGVNGKYLIYRGKPLLRENNMICYGDMANDKYVLFLMILNEKKLEIPGTSEPVTGPDKILVQILSTDKSKPAHERMVKQFEKNGLYDAMEIGMIWLDKLNAS